MDAEFEDYFSAKIGDQESVITPEALNALIEFIPDEMALPLRVDATYFLMTNFYLMAILPITTVKYAGNLRAMIAENAPIITEDVQLVLEAAEDVAQEREAQEISSTSCAIALGQVAGDLKLGSVQIWGPK